MSKTKSFDEARDLHFAFKNDTVRKFACRVVRHALVHGSFYSDAIDHSDIAKEDRNCIGSVFRWLRNVDILHLDTGHPRPSQAENARGRMIFSYVLVGRERAQTFLKRNDPNNFGFDGAVNSSIKATTEVFNTVNKQLGLL